MMGVATGADSSDNATLGIPELENVMGIMRMTAVAAFVSLLLAACAQEEKPEGVIPEGYKSALDKAQGVESKLEDSMQLQEQQLDQSEKY
jgi:hypothetical protein